MADKADAIDDFFNGGAIPKFLHDNFQSTVAFSRQQEQMSTTRAVIKNIYEPLFTSLNSLLIFLAIIAIVILFIRIKKMAQKLFALTEFRRSHIYRSFTHSNVDEI